MSYFALSWSILMQCISLWIKLRFTINHHFAASTCNNCVTEKTNVCLWNGYQGLQNWRGERKETMLDYIPCNLDSDVKLKVTTKQILQKL